MMVMTFQNPWTPEEDAVIVAGIAQELTWVKIAESLPVRTSRTARLRAERLGILPRRKMVDGDMCPVLGSTTLRESMEKSFSAFARRYGIGHSDARVMLMNCAGVA